MENQDDDKTVTGTQAVSCSNNAGLASTRIGKKRHGADEANQERAQVRDDLLDKSSKGVDGAFELRDVCAEESPHAVLVDHLDEQPEARLLTE